MSDPAAAPQEGPSPAGRPDAPPLVNEATTLSERDKAFSVAAALLGLFLAALDQTIVSTALPRIVTDLHGLELFSWVTTSYLLASTAMVPIYGKLSDIYGRRNVLLVGIGLFLASSVACGAAVSMELLIAMRAVQGLGAAALTTTAFVVVADLYEMPRRARIQGFFGAVFGLSSVIGPLLGGYLTDHLSWRWVFFVNLPIGAIAVAFIVAKMPALRSGRREPIDLVGSALLLAFTVPLLLAVTLDRTRYPWGGTETVALLATGLVAFVLFLVAESRAASPVLPLSMFRNAPLALGMAVSFVFGGAFLGAVLFIPLFLQRVTGVSASESGTAMTPLTIGIVVAAIASGRLSARLGKGKPFILAGLLVAMFAFWLLSRMDLETTHGGAVWRMLVLGLGLGPCMSLLNLIVQNAVDRREIGLATGVRQFFQQLGSVFGAALMGAMLTSGLQAEMPRRLGPVLEELPPQARARLSSLSPSQAARVEEGTPAGDSGDALQERLAAEAEAAQRALAESFERALGSHEPVEVARLVADPALPAAARDALQAPGGAPSPELVSAARRALEGAREQNLARARTAAGHVRTALREAFASAITPLFLLALFLAAMSFGLMLLLREAPYGQSPPPGPPVLD